MVQHLAGILPIAEARMDHLAGILPIGEARMEHLAGILPIAEARIEHVAGILPIAEARMEHLAGTLPIGEGQMEHLAGTLPIGYGRVDHLAGTGVQEVQRIHVKVVMFARSNLLRAHGAVSGLHAESTPHEIGRAVGWKGPADGEACFDRKGLARMGEAAARRYV